MIKKEGEKYILYSKDGEKKLGEFGSKKEAEDREKEINAIKHAKAEVSMTITKASLQSDGTMRWQATCSDTDPDGTGERTSLPLFGDWIERAEAGKGVDWLPPPRTPFLGLSHYPALDGAGEAGITSKMYVDGKCFKASGEFNKDTPLGVALFEAVRKEMGLVKMGHNVDDPIRISAAWWDLQHSHGDFVFSRRSLTERCPMCAEGAGDKVYLSGQLDHFAATRVPINPRTSLGLEEKSNMAKTRRDDAASIVGDERADELEEIAQKMVGKSETEEAAGMPAVPESLVIKADETTDIVAEPEPEPPAEQPEPEVAEEPSPLAVLESRIAAIEAQLSKGAIVTEEVKTEEVPEAAPNDPAAVLGTAVSAALQDEKLSRDDRLAAVQGALNSYAEAVKAELDAVAPPVPGEELATAIEKSLGAFAEKLDLLLAKLDERVSAVPATPPVAPQQKSYTPTGPVQPNRQAEPPKSPYTGQPSSLRALIERSVGMHQ